MSSSAHPRGPLAQLISDARVVVTAGSGGVGKTSVAAVLGMEAAAIGRRVVVVTIDPARRLADALGLDSEGTGEPTSVDGEWPGDLSVVMLDAKSTFDALVVGGAASTSQAERIIENPLYRSISGALSGTQEYMATEKLYELATDDSWDLVVVDTPPTRNALDFLTAPERLLRFFDHRLYKILTAPSRGVLKVANVAAQTFLRAVSKVVGGDLIDDVIDFFNPFEGMEAGFRERAAEVDQMLRSDDTSFVLVASPRRDTVAEAKFFADHLTGLGIEVRAAVVNRMSPEFGVPSKVAATWASAAGAESDFGRLASNLAELAATSELEQEHLEGLRSAMGQAPIVKVPQLQRELHDLEGLAELGKWLMAEP